MSQGEDDKALPRRSNVVPLGVASAAPLAPLPAKALSPAERGLKLVQSALVQQLGPVQAYNALVEAATEIREKIAQAAPSPPKPPREPTRER